MEKCSNCYGHGSTPRHGTCSKCNGTGQVEPKPPPVRVQHPHVVLDADGSPMIEGSRVPVRRIFGWHRQGTTCETLLRRYPQLGPARIFDAIAFAYDNLELMTVDLLRERKELAEQIHPVGRCTCAGEGRCQWCRESAARELKDQRDRQLDLLKKR